MESIGNLLFPVTLLLLLLLLACHASGCYKHELGALIELKSSISSPNGTALVDWSKQDGTGRPTNCCDWDEVHCGPCGRVVSLDLGGVSQVDWYVNTSLFLPFQHLQTLILINNSITGLTPHLRQLSSLKELYLGSNNLGRITDVYGSICQLQNIQNLAVGRNGLQGQFPLCFKNLTSLQSLDLSLNNLYGKLPSFLANLTTLQSLDLSSNQFSGNMTNSPLIKLTSLRDLTVSNNKFQIPRTLRLFANHSKLNTLWLDSNDFTPDNAIQQSVVPKFQLSSLSMSNCNIIGELPHFIISQYNLRYLDLSHNFIEGSFPNWILESNKPLNFLNLANNLFKGSLHLSRHYQLKVLDVSNNQISDLSTNLSQMVPNLLFLNLSRNLIEVITPSTFGGMKNLSRLDLTYNHLKDVIPKNSFKGCFSLEVLYLSHNYLRVTPSLSDSISLRILRVSNNNLSEMVASSLSPSSLMVLDMSNNNLRGQIPASFCKFNFLNFLDLSNNKFSGFLPSCFNGSNLAFAFLNKNKLNGSLLSVFKNNTSLVMLDLGNNLLSGVIPRWIGNLRSLNSLILKNNNFGGEIPNQICSLDQLAILDLSSNSLSGQIPRCLNQLTFQPLLEKSFLVESPTFFPNINSAIRSLTSEYIHVFEYFDSIFTIQSELEITTKSHTYTYMGKDLDGMSALDMSCNNLSGEITPELGRIIGVCALNLSHNKLDGLIPSTLSKLSYIESLDLSYNHLSGSIPVELMRLYDLEVFSVAYNNLSGSIPEKSQFDTFDESSYRGNPYLCGPPLLKNCSTYLSGIPKDQSGEDVDGSFDMYVFHRCFIVSSVIMFVGTLVVLFLNTHWRRAWFYFAEMWITCVYYFIVDNTRV